MDQSSGIRVLLKGTRTPEEPDLGTIMICVEPDKASTADWQQKVFTALLMAFLNQSTTSVSGSDSSAPWLNMANTLRDEAEKQQELQIAINGSDFISLPTLLRSARAGISALITDDKKRIRLEDFNPLLAGLQISPPQPTIFFSYSHDDKDLRDELDKHLAPLRRRSKAKTWFDGAIGAGQNWEETIRKNLRSADVILLLISHNFINSEFIWNNELQPALDRHKNGECRVIPVLMKPCLWEGLPFGSLQMVPHSQETGRLKAITTWNNSDEAFTLVAQSIQQALNDLGID